MNAQTARKLTSEARTVEIDNINSAIERAAKSGDNLVRIDLKGNQAKFYNIVMSTLQDRGFEVDHVFGSDQRDGTDWNYLIINW